MKRMLINATQPEELRVAIVDGQTLYDLDIEVPGHGQKKDNIYKGRVSRVEPSLEACFVEYGAERHGFLPLREIAPAYHQSKSESGTRLTIKDAVREGQEVIVQVTKEERGTKGAALTTFVSLAGRYLVLMPNNPSAGGVSSKIEGADRDETRSLLSELVLPQGAGVIVRTAGGGRSLEQLQWDLDYLKNIWEAICHAADDRSAPFLIYQESNVIIRALRDHFSKDIGEVVIDDADVLEEARGFVEMVMPQHLGKLKRHEDRLPLFTRFQIESQIDAAFQRQVRLPSGGALVLDQTEALVAVDVNSARATQGSDINETALNTNLEAAEEIARQLRLRDIGGLIVVDFIDMNNARNLREVENKLHQSLALDRARIQIGRISRFGLLEMSRQRLRPALSEAVFEPCPRCSGKGMIRSVESLAISILRHIQQEALKERTARITAELPVSVATFLVNEKRTDLVEIENQLCIGIVIIPNPHMDTPNYRVERIRSDQLGAQVLPSHELAEEPEAPAMPGKPAPAEQPAVSALRPATPPPAPAPEAKAKAGSRNGWFTRLLGRLASQEQDTSGSGSAAPAQRKRSSVNRNRRSDSGQRGENATRSRRQRPASNNAKRDSRGGAQRAGGNRARNAPSGDPAGSSNRKQAARKPNDKKQPPAQGSATAKAEESASSRAGSETRSTAGNEGSGRSRTRRGRRGGRRRRSAGNGNSQSNERPSDDQGSGKAQSMQDEKAAGKSLVTSAAQTDPGQAPGKPHAGRAERKGPPTEETPRLAALFEQERNSESAGHDDRG
ncbi:MAG: Rne/Rng family ribonuclease [Gammaproteobacteria bacterium]|nr:Rne/Rng family ribonuclease [Gammaproteobacteria bacterium]